MTTTPSLMPSLSINLQQWILCLLAVLYVNVSPPPLYSHPAFRITIPYTPNMRHREIKGQHGWLWQALLTPSPHVWSRFGTYSLTVLQTPVATGLLIFAVIMIFGDAVRLARSQLISCTELFGNVSRPTGMTLKGYVKLLVVADELTVHQYGQAL